MFMGLVSKPGIKTSLKYRQGYKKNEEKPSSKTRTWIKDTRPSLGIKPNSALCSQILQNFGLPNQVNGFKTFAVPLPLSWVYPTCGLALAHLFLCCLHCSAAPWRLSGRCCGPGAGGSGRLPWAPRCTVQQQPGKEKGGKGDKKCGGLGHKAKVPSLNKSPW